MHTFLRVSQRDIHPRTFVLRRYVDSQYRIRFDRSYGFDRKLLGKQRLHPLATGSLIPVPGLEVKGRLRAVAITGVDGTVLCRCHKSENNEKSSKEKKTTLSEV